ncbi:hypothetical protein CR152_25490 [Massilia violaceinigra]|uniref:JAB domain-containing protein n=2 Tax=Massilia violaceinigra TaxID=2045208 RepID=A0A2D2DR77_9BURK|nr:hypothetical protein CR152_25490 [Massilia violaceinigra]
MKDDKIEHGALLIRYADGSVGASKITSGIHDEVKMRADIAPGDKIIGYIHSHTYDDVVDQRLPSRHDFETAAELRKNPHADPHLLLYILDMKTNSVYEYHSGQGPSTKQVGPNITKDVIKP